MLRPIAIALFLIAAPALSTVSNAQNVYKCGAAYSQIPCEGSVSLNLSDQRSKEQQLQSGAVATKDAKAAAAMERARRQEEKRTSVENSTAPKKVRPTSTVPEKKPSSVPTTTILSSGSGNKNSRNKVKESEFFTAAGAAKPKKSKNEK